MPSPTSLEEWTELEGYHVCAATIGFVFILFGYRLYKPSLFLGGCAAPLPAPRDTMFICTSLCPLLGPACGSFCTCKTVAL
jgi:hypothetical protein